MWSHAVKIVRSVRNCTAQQSLYVLRSLDGKIFLLRYELSSNAEKFRGRLESDGLSGVRDEPT